MESPGHEPPSAPSAPSGSFYRFPILPLEIRTQIWKFALRVPRTITIVTIFHEPIHTHDFIVSRHKVYCHASQDPPPSLLHVSSESRLFAQEYYTQAFNLGSHPRYTYVNFFLDTIIMPDCDLRSLSHGKDRSAIRRLVLTVERTEAFLKYWFDKRLPLMFNMPQLEAVTSIYRVTQQPRSHPTQYYEEKLRKTLIWENLTCKRSTGWVCPDIKFLIEGEGEASGLSGVKILTRKDTDVKCWYRDVA